MPVRIAGTEVYAHTLASLQKAAGHEVTVITPHFENDYPGQMMGKYSYDGIDVIQYMEPSLPKREFFLAKQPPAGLKNFHLLLNEIKPDIVHFHELTRGIGLGIPHLKVAKKANAKVIFTMHLSGYACGSGRLVKRNKLCHGVIREFDCSVCYMKTLYGLPEVLTIPIAATGIILDKLGILSKLPGSKPATLLSMPLVIRRIKDDLMSFVEHTDHLVVLGQWFKQILIDNGVPADKISLIPQGLASINSNHPGKPNIPATLPLRMLFIGRVQRQKGLHLLIEALKKLPPDKVILDIYGKEEDTAYYKDCLEKSKGLAINWKGTIDRDKVLEMMKDYHILCLPSAYSEMSPLVIQEAFSVGIPVLASKVYGNLEHVQHNLNGLLFELNSSAGLREQIQRLVDDPALIAKLADNIKMPSTFHEVNQSYLKLYSSLGVNTSGSIVV